MQQLILQLPMGSILIALCCIGSIAGCIYCSAVLATYLGVKLSHTINRHTQPPQQSRSAESV